MGDMKSQAMLQQTWTLIGKLENDEIAVILCAAIPMLSLLMMVVRRYLCCCLFASGSGAGNDEESGSPSSAPAPGGVTQAWMAASVRKEIAELTKSHEKELASLKKEQEALARQVATLAQRLEETQKMLGAAPAPGPKASSAAVLPALSAEMATPTKAPAASNRGVPSGGRGAPLSARSKAKI
jgi:hypothetical protein